MRISSMPILMQSPSLSGKMPTSKPENTLLNCTNSQRDLAVAEDLNPRTVLAVTRFRGVLLRPLGHATAVKLTESAHPHPNRWRAKKASSGAAHSCASTPPRTSGR